MTPEVHHTAPKTFNEGPTMTDSESRVDRLLRKAEEAIDAGDHEQGYNYVNIADTALEQRRQDEKQLRKMAKASRGN